MTSSDDESNHNRIYTRNRHICPTLRVSTHPTVPTQTVVPLGGFCPERTLFEARFLHVLVDENIRFAKFKSNGDHFNYEFRPLLTTTDPFFLLRYGKERITLRCRPWTVTYHINNFEMTFRIFKELMEFMLNILRQINTPTGIYDVRGARKLFGDMGYPFFKCLVIYGSEIIDDINKLNV